MPVDKTKARQATGSPDPSFHQTVNPGVLCGVSDLTISRQFYFVSGKWRGLDGFDCITRVGDARISQNAIGSAI